MNTRAACKCKTKHHKNKTRNSHGLRRNKFIPPESSRLENQQNQNNAGNPKPYGTRIISETSFHSPGRNQPVDHKSEPKNRDELIDHNFSLPKLKQNVPKIFYSIIFINFNSLFFIQFHQLCTILIVNPNFAIGIDDAVKWNIFNATLISLSQNKRNALRSHRSRSGRPR